MVDKTSSRVKRGWQTLKSLAPFPSLHVILHWPSTLQRLTIATVHDRNAWRLCVEIFWASILNSVAAFNATLALRLGAESSHIGLLSSLPALLAILVSIPTGRLLERQANRKGWVLGSLALHRCGYALVVLVPLLPSVALNRGAVLVALLVTMSTSATFFGVGFNSMLADVVPERRRAAVFATRNIISVTVTSLVTFLSGQWLNRVTFPINYQILYALGFVASMVSLYVLTKVHVPEAAVAPSRSRGRPSVSAQWRSLRVIVHEQPAFVRLTLDTLLFNLPAWTVGPLYILYFIRELGATDAWIGLHGMVANVGAIAGYALWQRVIGHWGESRTLRRTAPGAGIYPMLVGLLHSLTPILFAVGLDGLIVPGINLSHFNIYLKSCPPDRRPLFMGLYATIMNIGAFVCPLLGVVLADRFGLPTVLLACGLVRIVAGLTFTVWPVRITDVGEIG
ncbi:MAG: MFS transporter [Chloroflexi bacterium]|nr:MFS transporter [Chloroflexota bacterium]